MRQESNGVSKHSNHEGSFVTLHPPYVGSRYLQRMYFLSISRLGGVLLP